MSIKTELDRLNEAKSSLKTAIEEKGVSVPEETKIDGYGSLVEQIKQGGGDTSPTAQPKEVNFYDYDGTLRYSYTLEEAKALESLPPGPTHEGLTFQEWNWTLTDIKNLDYDIDIGATYITDDGKTRLYITIPKNSMPNRPPPQNQIPLYIRQTISNGIVIDWGDNSLTETISGTNNVSITHVYKNAGNYVITLNPQGECKLELGNNSTSYSVIGSSSESVYRSFLYMAQIGRNVIKLGSSAFYSNLNLEFLTIPNNVLTLGTYAIYNCNALKTAVIPSGVTSIENSAISNMASIKNVLLPNSVTKIDNLNITSMPCLKRLVFPNKIQSLTSCVTNCHALLTAVFPKDIEKIGSQSLKSCRSLSSITIPASVTSIDSSVLSECPNLKEYHLMPPSPPTLSSSAFSNGASNRIFYVPAGTLETYKTATNWAALADQIQEEPV